MTILQSLQQLLQACELRWVYAGDLNWWLLFLSTGTILFARRASQGNLISITMTVPTTYLLSSKVNGYWSMIKFAFNIPLVLTNSTMCIINSISEDANIVKIPNIVVNTITVLIMSLYNSIKASEKCELCKK